MDSWQEIALGKLGKTFTGLAGKTKDDFGFGKPYIPYMNVFANGRINPDQLEYVRIKKNEQQNQVKYGDIFFTTSSETINEVGMTSVLLDDLGEAYLNSFCFGFRLHDFETIIPEFVPYLFRSEAVRHQITLQGQGSTRYNLSKKEMLEKLILRIPSKPEQRRIAQILYSVDLSIEKTKKVILKFQRIKTGLMQALLTKGIDTKGNIRREDTHKFVMKNGVKVPEDWGVKPLGDVCSKIQDGTHFSPKTSDDGEFMYLTSKNIRFGYLDLSNVEFINAKQHEDIYRRCSVKFGDVLLTKDGANTGNAAINNLHEQFSLLSSVCIIRGKENVLDNNFLLNLLLCERGQRLIKDSMSGLAITRVTLQIINKFTVPIPSMPEQIEISNKIQQIENSILIYRKDLEKFQSIKTGLMQDLLSGKLRVTA